MLCAGSYMNSKGHNSTELIESIPQKESVVCGPIGIAMVARSRKVITLRTELKKVTGLFGTEMVKSVLERKLTTKHLKTLACTNILMEFSCNRPHRWTIDCIYPGSWRCKRRETRWSLDLLGQ